MVTYLNTIFHASYPQDKVGVRTSRELRTIAETLDELRSGHLPRAADLLMQRFKALEASVQDGSWGLAQNLELMPLSQIGLTSLEGQREAAKQELQHLKLLEARKKHKG